MVFYFSGTGGSQLIAQNIAKALNDEIISINKALKGGKANTYSSKLPFVFVAPTYSWRIPLVVNQWICENNFEGNTNAYFVLTCGGNVGNAGSYAKNSCNKKGLIYRGLSKIVMPENYIALFRVPKEEKCKNIIENSLPIAKALADKIKKNEDFDVPQINVFDKFLSGPVNPIFYKLFVHDKGFSVGDGCVSCNKCAERCPLNNIELINGKPIWKGNCTHCMACIAGCPTKAIEYKSNSKGQYRYFVFKD